MSYLLKIEDEEYIVKFLTYEKPRNMAITVSTLTGKPYCALSTNPEYELGDYTVAIRDDETLKHHIRDALVQAGVLESTNVRIQMGYITATIYKVSKEVLQS